MNRDVPAVVGVHLIRIDGILVLGCNGCKEDDGFHYCSGVNNPILELKNLNESDYKKVSIFFDNACGLFQSSISDINKCSNILNMLYKNYKVIDTNMLNKIQYYLNMHKKCRPFLILMLREDYYGKQ